MVEANIVRNFTIGNTRITMCRTIRTDTEQPIRRLYVSRPLSGDLPGIVTPGRQLTG